MAIRVSRGPRPIGPPRPSSASFGERSLETIRPGRHQSRKGMPDRVTPRAAGRAAADRPAPACLQSIQENVLPGSPALGLTPHLSQGVSRTIIGVIGDEEKLQVEPLQAIPGVERVVPILKAFKLASREFHAEDSVFTIKGIKIGGGHLAVIAGPCA